MTKKATATDKNELRAWYKRKLNEVVKEMLRIGAVTGVAVDASPMWAVPHQILIAKVWNTHEKSKFIWTISGERVTTDHIAGSAAKGPQAAARHFALKWQMDADRLGDIAQGKSQVENSKANMEGYTQKLIQYAELLYDLASRDEIWKPKHH